MTLIKKIGRTLSLRFRQTMNDFLFLFSIVPMSIKTTKGLRIIVYHGICKKNPYKFNSRFLSEKQFESHLIIFKRFFNMVSLEDLKANQLSNKKLNVMITFDDGYRNNFELAIPLLEKHQTPAVFFVTTLPEGESYLFNDVLDVFSFIGPSEITINTIRFTKEKYFKHYRYFSERKTMLAQTFQNLSCEGRSNVVKQLYAYVPKENFIEYKEYMELMNKEMLVTIASKKEMAIGSHGVSHVDLSKISPHEAKEEIATSKRVLTEITGQTIDTIAFPYGRYNKELIMACKASNYLQLFGTELLNQTEDRELIIRRLTINPYISSINQAYSIAESNYD